jgi:hypothetical protein
MKISSESGVMTIWPFLNQLDNPMTLTPRIEINKSSGGIRYYHLPFTEEEAKQLIEAIEMAQKFAVTIPPIVNSLQLE